MLRRSLPLRPPTLNGLAFVLALCLAATVSAQTRVWVTGHDNLDLYTTLVVDPQSGELLDQVCLDDEGYDASRPLADGTKVYFGAGNGLTFVDPLVLQEEATGLGAVVALVAHPASHTLYVEEDAPGADLLAVDTETQSIVDQVDLDGFGEGDTTGLSVRPDGAELYVGRSDTGGANPRLLVLDPATLNLLGEVPGAQAGPVAPDGSKLYAPGGSGLLVVDLASRMVVDEITLADASHLAMDPAGGLLYAGTPASATSEVTVIDTATDDVLLSFDLDGVLQDLAVAPDGTQLFVAILDGALAIVDTATFTESLRVDLVDVEGCVFLQLEADLVAAVPPLGGSVPCADVATFTALCPQVVARPFAGPRTIILATVTLMDSSHDGQTVSIAVDGVANQVAVEGDRAQLSASVLRGDHVVSLEDPVGCFPDIPLHCP